MCVQIQRGVAYERSSKEVSRWETVIRQNQKAEQIIFPLKQEPAGPKRVEQVVAGWKVCVLSLCVCARMLCVCFIISLTVFAKKQIGCIFYNFYNHYQNTF